MGVAGERPPPDEAVAGAGPRPGSRRPVHPGARGPASRARRPVHPLVRAVAVAVAVLVAYVALPVDAERAPIGVLAGILVSVAALASVVKVIVVEARSARRRLTGWHLTLALEIALVVFSFCYYVLASNDPEEFVGLATRLDAIYFSTATAATVGFGDVHAAGAISRAVVTLHMVFNIVFVAAVVSLLRDRISERRSVPHPPERTAPRSDAPRSDAPRSDA